MQNPDVLVVIVNYKSAQLALGALQSLTEERARNPDLRIEAVVVENASGDEAALREGIGRFSEWATLVVSAVNGGYGAGNNVGLRWAFEQGRPPRYFHLLNPDTVVHPDGVAGMVRFMDATPRAGIAGNRIQNPDGNDWPYAFRFPSAASELLEGAELGVLGKLLKGREVLLPMGDEPKQVDWMPGASMMLRREVVEQVGGFDEEFFLYYEETDLCRRAKAAGWEIWYAPYGRVMHICGQSTGVTVQGEGPKRKPRYTYESRRRYFVKNHGYTYAALADLAYLAGNAVGGLKKVIKREPKQPYLFRDFLRDTVLLPQNRKGVNPPRQYAPAVGSASAASSSKKERAS